MLPSELRHLPVDDRLTLVAELWDSIAHDQSEIELTDEQKAELDRRLEARDRRGDVGSTWPEVKRRVLGQ